MDFINTNLTAAQIDSLFLQKDLLVIVYVDDLLIYVPNNNIINTFIKQMQAE